MRLIQKYVHHNWTNTTCVTSTTECSWKSAQDVEIVSSYCGVAPTSLGCFWDSISTCARFYLTTFLRLYIEYITVHLLCCYIPSEWTYAHDTSEGTLVQISFFLWATVSWCYIRDTNCQLLCSFSWVSWIHDFYPMTFYFYPQYFYPLHSIVLLPFLNVMLMDWSELEAR